MEQERQVGLPSARERQMGLRAAISNTENLLRNVDPSVTGRTQGSLVTEAQRSKIVQNERQPYAEQFREQSRALEGETANLADLSSRAMSGTQMALGEQSAQERQLQELYQTLYGREQAEEEKRRWEQQQAEARRQWEAQQAESIRQFNEGQRASQAQAAALRGQQDALARAFQTRDMSVPSAPAAGGQRYAPGASPQEVQRLATASRAPSTFSASNIANAFSGGYFGKPGQAIAKHGPLALLGKGVFW